MPSPTETSNLALQLIRESAVASIEQPTNKAGRECQLAFAPSRDAVLRALPWSFAKKRKVLPEATETPAFGKYALQYILPDDYIRTIGLPDDQNPGVNPWVVEGGVILTNYGPPLDFYYIHRLENYALYDPMFVQAHAAYMASILAQSIAKNATLADQMEAMFERRVARAAMVSGQEQTPDEMAEDTYVTVRA